MRAHRVFLTISGVGSFASACAFTLGLVYQIEVVGLDPLQLVLVGTTLEVVCVVAQVPTGLIADLSSRRLSVIVGFLLTGAGGLLIGLVPTFAAVLLGNVVWGVGLTCVDGALEAWAADETGEAGIGHLLTRGSQVASAAAVVGIAACVGLASLRLDLPIVVGAATWLGLGLFLLVAMPERHYTPDPGRPAVLRAMRSQVGAGTSAIRGRPVLICLLAAILFGALGSEGFDRLGADHFLTDLPFPAVASPVVWLGGLNAAAMLASIALTEVVRRTGALHAVRAGRIAVVFQAAVVAGVMVFALAGQFWLAAAAWLGVELFREASHPLRGTWLVAQTSSSSRATVISFAGMVDAAGQIAGGPPVGLVGRLGSVRLALLTSGVLMAPAVAFLIAALNRQPAHQAAAGPVSAAADPVVVPAGAAPVGPAVGPAVPDAVLAAE